MKTITLELRMKDGYNHNLKKPYSKNYKEKIKEYVETPGSGLITMSSNCYIPGMDLDTIVGKIKSVNDTTATIDIYCDDIAKRLYPMEDYVLAFTVLGKVYDDHIEISRIVGGFIDAKREVDRQTGYPTSDNSE